MQETGLAIKKKLILWHCVIYDAAVTSRVYLVSHLDFSSAHALAKETTNSKPLIAYRLLWFVSVCIGDAATPRRSSPLTWKERIGGSDRDIDVATSDPRCFINDHQRYDATILMQ